MCFCARYAPEPVCRPIVTQVGFTFFIILFLVFVYLCALRSQVRVPPPRHAGNKRKKRKLKSPLTLYSKYTRALTYF